MNYRFLITCIFLVVIHSCSKDDVKEDVNENSENNPPTQEVDKVVNKKATGNSSKDLLSSNKYKSMVVEVVYVEGYEPTQNAINNFKSFLEARTYKPEGITIEKRAISSLGKTKYSIDDIISIEDDNRTKYNTNNKIAVWVFFTDGESAKNTNNGVVLGTAYRNTSFVIFEETIRGLSNGAFEPDRDLLETTVITHEFGHILGLTNLGASMVNSHEDTEHSKHCNVESCLMFWSAETGDGLSNLVGSSSAPQLDDQCIADLQANGGK